MGTSMVVMADTGTSLAGTDMDTVMDMALGSDMDGRTDLGMDFPTVSQFTPNLLSQQQHLGQQPQLNPRLLVHPPMLPLLLSRSSLTLARLTTTSPSMRRSLLT